jgi:hypothetical protein
MIRNTAKHVQMPPMRLDSLRSVVVLFAVLFTLTGCKFGSEVKQFTRDVQAAGKELTETLGVQTHTNVAAEDLESPRVVTVSLQAMPPGLTREQVERNANIVVRKHLPRVEQVKVIFPAEPR